MLGLIKTMGRVLLWHAPALVAIYLIGHTAHYLLIHLTGFVNAFTPFGRIFLLPLPVLAKLVTFVAMILITRSALNNLGRIAPLAEQSRDDRRRGFVEAIYSSIVPFFTFYTLAGFLRDDIVDTSQVAVQVSESLGLDLPQTNLAIEPLTIGIVIACFAAKQFWSLFKRKLPKWTRVVVVYFDVVWVLLTISVLSELLNDFNAWVASRAGVVWIWNFGHWFSINLAPIAAVWEVLVAVVSAVVTITVIPLAWLTMTGVIFGESLAAQEPNWEKIVGGRFTRRFKRLGAGAKRRVGEVAWMAGARVKPLWNAFLLMLRAGPALIGFYILLYLAWVYFDRILNIVVPSSLGPHDGDFWNTMWPFVALVIDLISQPIRIALIVATYDATLGRIGRKAHQAAPIELPIPVDTVPKSPLG